DSGSFGPEIAFGYYYRQARPDARLAIVKYAHGGTGIARSEDYTDYIPTLAGFQDHGHNWSPPDASRKAGNLYAGLLEGVRAATAALDEQQVPWQLAGLLWMQGEHEAGI